MHELTYFPSFNFIFISSITLRRCWCSFQPLCCGCTNNLDFVNERTPLSFLHFNLYNALETPICPHHCGRKARTKKNTLPTECTVPPEPGCHEYNPASVPTPSQNAVPLIRHFAPKTGSAYQGHLREIVPALVGG